MAAGPTKVAAWNALNPRQQEFLRVIYAVDQEVEEYERDAWADNRAPRPASVWRWLEYGMVGSSKLGPLKTRLEATGLRDQGTGSTFAVLAEAKLVQLRRDPVEPVEGEAYHLDVKLTAHGRAVARAGGTAGGRPGAKQLSEWLWEVLVSLWVAGDSGVDGYRRITAWRRLQSHKAGCLAEKHGSAYDKWVLSDAGREHYQANWARYVKLYPTVRAPHPDGERQWPAAADRTLTDQVRAVQSLGEQLRRLRQDAETARATAAASAPPVPAAPTPETQRAVALTTARFKLATANASRTAKLLAEHVDELLGLYRASAARAAGAANAAVLAVVAGEDPLAALAAAKPLALDDEGRPVEQLTLPVTGLSDVDGAIATLHATLCGYTLTGPRRKPKEKRRTYQPTPEYLLPPDGAAGRLEDYAAYLAWLLAGGQLQRLLHRADAGAV